MIKKIIEIFLFGSIFISICSVAMCIETSLLLHLPLNSTNFYLFVFGATLVQYNLHYLFKTAAVTNSKRLAWSLKNKQTHKILIGIGIVLIIYSLFNFPLQHLIILLVLGVIAFLYSFPFLPFTNQKRIKDFGLLKIITLALTWTLVTVWFPVGEEVQYTDFSFQLVFLRRFIFIFILCLLFDIRDIELDRKDNIRTLPVMLGIKKAYLLCYILLMAFIALTVSQYFYLPAISTLIAMLTSAMVTAFTIEYSKRNNSDIFYLASIDGMMFLQALLVVIGSVYFH